MINLTPQHITENEQLKDRAKRGPVVLALRWCAVCLRSVLFVINNITVYKRNVLSVSLDEYNFWDIICKELNYILNSYVMVDPFMKIPLSDIQ